MKYKPSISTRKGLVAGGWVGFIALIIAMVQRAASIPEGGEFTVEPPELEMFSVLLVAGITFLVNFARNWWKHRKDGDVNRVLTGGLILLCLCPVSLGCAGINPATFQRTSLKVSAVDTAGGQLDPALGIVQTNLPENAQYTRVDIEGRLAAGVEISDAVNFLVNRESGVMSLNQGKEFNSSQQAELNAIYASIIPAMTASIVTAVQQTLGAYWARPPSAPGGNPPVLTPELVERIGAILPALEAIVRGGGTP